MLARLNTGCVPTPGGFRFDTTHHPHITLGQHFVDADAVDAVAAAGYARALVDVGNAGTADPVLFPGSPVASLSEYVAIMRRMQTGDMMG